MPVATYHAYNSIGGGCYYNDPILRRSAAKHVSLRHPGGGFGAQFGEPVDPYDPASPRQQFSHWDTKFIRWLRAEGVACDFYTDLDLHENSALDFTKYRCMLSVGHHEYWSHEMREHVARFVEQGGNLAVFSGNTCYRPVKFTCDAAGNPIGMRKLAGDWDLLTEKPNNDPPACGNLSDGDQRREAETRRTSIKSTTWSGGWPRSRVPTFHPIPTESMNLVFVALRES